MPIPSDPVFYCKDIGNHPHTSIQRHTATEAFLDWIEIRRVRRQKTKNVAASLNYFLEGTRLVNCTVVENQDALVLRVRVHFWQLNDS